MNDTKEIDDMIVILHNHQYAQAMRDDLGEIKGQINKVKEEEIDAFLGLNIENEQYVELSKQRMELRTQTTTNLPIESSNYEEMEWLGLFKKKSGGSDWGDALLQEISTENDTP